MNKFKQIVSGIFVRPEEKMAKLAYVPMFLMAAIGFFAAFAAFGASSAIFGFDFGDFLKVVLLGLVMMIVYGFIGYLVGLGLRCYVELLRNQRRQADAQERIAQALEMSLSMDDTDSEE